MTQPETILWTSGLRLLLFEKISWIAFSMMDWVPQKGGAIKKYLKYLNYCPCLKTYCHPGSFLSIKIFTLVQRTLFASSMVALSNCLWCKSTKHWGCLPSPEIEFFEWTRPNEFGSMTARKDGIQIFNYSSLPYRPE